MRLVVTVTGHDIALVVPDVAVGLVRPRRARIVLAARTHPEVRSWRG
ncbi:hypothetical protein [Nocardia sp. NPDC052112]